MKRKPEGWKLTLGLCGLALAAALIAPQLLPEPEPTIEAEAAACVRLGPYECCYDPPEEK